MIMPNQPVARPLKNPTACRIPAALQPDEMVLVRRARRGDRPLMTNWFAGTKSAYTPRFIHDLNHEDANDLAQEAFIKGFRRSSLSKAGRAFIPGLSDRR